MDKNFTPPRPRQMFAPEPLSVRLRAWRPSVMQLALAISVSLHAAVLGVRFVDPEDFNRVFQDTPLEVVLVNARSTEAPTKAQAIAQANLAGGGEAEAGIATSPLPPSPSQIVGDDQTDTNREIQQQQQTPRLWRLRLPELPPTLQWPQKMPLAELQLGFCRRPLLRPSRRPIHQSSRAWARSRRSWSGAIWRPTIFALWA